MANIVPFDSGTIPAYIKQADVADLNNDLIAHAGAGFPVVSIKGKVFAIVRDGERKILPNPKDPESPAPYIDVVLVKANRGTSKVFYAKGYTEGVEGVKPDCFSNDGVKPDAMVEAPQASLCATCPNNVWGSKIGENGQKGKACQDSVRLAIATPGALKDPHLLRVPPASIRALGEYGKILKARGVKYDGVITKIGFVSDVATPQLTFKPVGFLPEELYSQVQEVAASDVVQSILGSVVVPVEPADPVDKAKATPAKLEKPKATVKAAEPVKVAEPVKAAAAEPTTIEIDLDSLKFDD